MSSSLIRSGFNALRDRSRIALSAIAGAGLGAHGHLGSEGGEDDTLDALGPGGWTSLASSVTGHGWRGDDYMSDLRRLVLGFVLAALILVLVSITNPTEASFRSHLTELAFRRHLAHIRSSSNETISPDAGSTTADAPRSGHSTPIGFGNDAPTVAPFRFANHVAISLRTPSLSYGSYFFFSLAFAAAPGPPAFLSDPLPTTTKATKHATGGSLPPVPAIAYIGILGHWFVLGQVPRFIQWSWRLVRGGRREKARKKASLVDRPGVLDMRAVLPKDELPPARGVTLVPKLLFKSESHKDLTDLLPLHSTPSSLPVAGLTPESRRGSIVNLIASPPTPPLPDTLHELSSPILIALKADLATAQSALADVQAQLTAHDESVAAAHGHLQSTLDELRQRRKEDDAERQELKSKAKTLEDQKRQAEGARRDADKRLKAVEAVRDGIQAKIIAALDEMEDLKGNMDLSEKTVKIVGKEGARHQIETREAVEDRTRELSGLEREVDQLDVSNETLGQKVRDAEDQLKTAEVVAEESHKIAPEEEMMLMAAAYEAAASEGYLHGQRQNQADSQWASQAAAYMAEAGMPFLDQSYTARPAQTASTGYGHLSRAHPNSASYRSLTDKRVGDVPGFEDFGPGVNSRSLVTGRPATFQAAEEVEDPGSPIGQMSASFSANWLPQGLVRSLEGDATPLDVTGASDFDDDDEQLQIQDALRSSPTSGAPPVDGHESGSESGNEDSPPWRSPVTVDGRLDGGITHRRVMSSSRFLPHVTPPNPGGSASTLPNLGTLPSSRRWLSTSTTASSENVTSSLNLYHPGVGSNDSLNLVSGYEASPFAPSADEKRTLKWPLLGKSRWSGTNGNRSISGLDEIAASLKDGQGGNLGSPGFGSFAPGHGSTSSQSAQGLSAEELFNRAAVSTSPVPIAASSSTARASSFDLSPGGSWLSSRHFGGHGPDEGESESGAAGTSAERRQPFRFFSLRKGPAA